MSRHSGVIYCNKRERSLHDIGFGGDEWLRYLPIRIPDTICIQDQVPPGAAAVLINRTKIYKDLFLVIGKNENRIFDAIDGQRTIAEIAERTSSSSNWKSHLRKARNFLEQLWWHDQVVFATDNSNTQPGGSS